MKLGGTKNLLLGCLLFVVLHTAQAIPFFNITASSKVMNLAVGTTTTVTYTVKNIIDADIHNMEYIPPLLTSLSSASTCSSTLSKGSSCTVVLTVQAPKVAGIILLDPLRVCGMKQELLCSVADAQDRVRFNVIDTDPVRVVGKVLTQLPANTEMDTNYPVVFTFSNSNKVLPATGISLFKTLPDFKESTNTCKDSIAPSGSCQLSGTYNPSKVGPVDLSVTLSYKEGRDVTETASSTVSDVAVRGVVSTPLPNNVELDTNYPVVFTFSNSNKVLPATGISLFKTLPDFKESTNTCKDSIAPSGSCQLSGTYNPSKVGPVDLSVTLSYKEGRDVTETASSTVSDVAVRGVVSTPLPNNVELDTNYPVVFTFSNSNKVLPATGISLFKTLPDFKESTNTCKDSIAPSGSCQLSGTYNPSKVGPVDLSVTLSYKEGRDVTETASSTVSDVAVRGVVSTPLPNNVELDTNYPVVFTFSNSNKVLPATGISLFKTLPDFKESTNTCKDSIAPSGSCQLSGTYNPSKVGPVDLSVTLSYKEGRDVTETASSTVSDVAVRGVVSTPLPNNVELDTNYPVVFTFSNSNKVLPATGISLFKTLPDFKESTNTCKDSIAPSGSCQLSGTYNPSKVGPVDLSVTLSYKEGRDVTETASSTVSDVAVRGVVSTPLPNNVELDTNYPVVFTFSNSNKVLPATGISLFKTLPDFKESTNTCKDSIAPSGSCQLSGTYNPSKVGPVDLSVTLSYREGRDVIETASSTVSDVAVRGVVSTPLPNNVELDTNYPVVFTFSNSNKVLPATGISLFKTLPDFKESTNTCKDSIAPSGSCQLSGTYNPSKVGPVDLSVTLSYREGRDVIETASSTVSDVAVRGVVSTPLPNNVELDTNYPVVFTFSNSNKVLPATGISLFKTLPDFKESTNTCKDSIAPSGSCQLSGTYNPSKVGPVDLSVTLSYKEGRDVIETASSTVSDVAVRGVVSTPLPNNVELDTNYPVVFTFSNSNKVLPATGISLFKTLPDFKESTNTCKDSIAPSGSCQLSGTYNPSKVGPVDLSVTLSYKEGRDVTETASSTVSDVAVRGVVSTPLPNNVELDTNYPVVFTFSNSNKVLPATGISLFKTLPDFKESTNTCKDSIAPSGSCQLSGTYNPSKVGPVDLSVTLSYKEGRDVTETASSTVSDVAVRGVVSTPLPNNVELDTNYPVVFTFSNSNKVLPATGISLFKTLPDFKESTNTCKDSIAPSGSCQLSGTYNPSKVGPVDLSVTLSYKEGRDVTETASSTVSDVAVRGVVSTPLPNNVELDTNYPVVFTFSNSNKVLPATGISLFKTLPDFKESTNTCKDSIAPSGSCQLSGTYNPTSVGPAALSVTLSYNEGNNVSASTSTTVSNVVVTGSVSTPLPDTAQTNIDYPVTFTFRNTGNTEATGINIFKNFSNFTENNNTCTTTLAAFSSCSISGTFNSFTTGSKAISINLLYDKGVNVLLSTSTAVVSKLYLYISNEKSGVIIKCEIAQNGNLINCVDAGGNALLNIPSNMYINRSVFRAYILNMGNDTSTPIILCDIDASRNFTNCRNSGAKNIANRRGLIARQNINGIYVGDLYRNIVSTCVSGSNGSLSGCRDAYTSGTIGGPHGFAFGANETYLYIAQYSKNTITKCELLANNDLSNCVNSGVTSFNKPENLAMNLSNTYLYVTNAGKIKTSITRCEISATDGALSNCVDTGNINVPLGIKINPNGRYAYITSRADNAVLKCNLDPSGLITSCVNQNVSGINGPRNLEITGW